MINLIIVVIFVWLSVKLIGVTLKLTWCAAKIVASLLFVVALPALIGCILFAGGILILFPILLLGIAFGVVRSAS